MRSLVSALGLIRGPLAVVAAISFVSSLGIGVMLPLIADCVVRATLGSVAMEVLERGGAVRVGPGVTANVLLGAAVARSSGVDDHPFFRE